MLYKKGGGLGHVRAWGRRAAAHAGYEVGIINLTTQIEQQLDKINQMEQIVLDSFEGQKPLQLAIGQMRANLQTIKDSKVF